MIFTKPVICYSIIPGRHQIHNLKWINSDNLRVQNIICIENGSTTEKAIFTRITTIPENGVGPQTVGLNSPRCHILRSSRDLVSIHEILRETVSARNFYQSESRWFDIWEPAFTEFYFRLHRRRTNVYLIKIRACHNMISILRTTQDKGRKVCTV